MKGLLLLLVCLILTSCQSPDKLNTKEIDQVLIHFQDGDFDETKRLISTVETKGDLSDKNAELLYEIQQKMHRIVQDFSKTEKQIVEELSVLFPDLKEETMNQWINTNQLEMRLINGQRTFFRNAVSNLARLNPVVKQKRDSLYGPRDIGLSDFRSQKAQKTITTVNSAGMLTKHKWHIEFSITLDANTVPAGEIVKCWLPFPRPNRRQNEILLTKTSQEDFQLATEDVLQRSLYMEQKSVTDSSLHFSYEAIFTTTSEWHDLNSNKFQTSTISEQIAKDFTKEIPPHLVFSEPIKKLADSLCLGLTDQRDQVRALYYWINMNIPWASALEYSTFDCIPEYVLEKKHGDCGMVTLLFMSMARYKGIPVKWQSGWMLHPGYKNLHDWAEVYYEGVGWIPLDMSFGLIASENRQTKEFYLSGIDAYRLIINDDFSKDFHPNKHYFRSEPIDFQRGELEWRNGNLYFDQWDYHLKIISHEEI